jgi:hypothetical protein
MTDKPITTAEEMREAAANLCQDMDLGEGTNPYAWPERLAEAIRALPVAAPAPLAEDCDLTVARLAGRGDAERNISAMRARAESAEAELARLRAAIYEASDPVFLLNVIENGHGINVTLADYVRTSSRAIRAALKDWLE